MPEDQQAKELALSVAVTEVLGDIKTDSFSLNVKNISYKPPKPNNTSIDVAASTLSKASNSACSVIALASDLGLSTTQCEYISKLVLAELAVYSLPKKTLEEEISLKILKKIFGYNEMLSAGRGEFVITIPVKTKNGKIEIDLINTVTGATWNGTGLGSFDSISYEAFKIEKNFWGGEKRAKKPFKTGVAGTAAIANAQAFFKSLSDYALENIKSASKKVLGDVEDVEKLLFGDCVSEVLSRAGYDSFFDFGWSIYVNECKKITVKCPVDVYIYNSQDKLCGAIINNVTVKLCDEIELEVINDDKIVKIWGDGYYIKTIATAEGTMSISVSENDYNNGARKIVSYKNLPLSVGTEYLQHYGEGFNVDSTVYDVVYEDGSTQSPDEEIMLLTPNLYLKETIQFGSYPQSRVTDSKIISALNSKAPAWSKWTSYGYYTGTGSSGTMKQDDWMKYTDVTYNGTKYRGVKFTQYRPYFTYNESSAENSYQDANGYNTNTVYWFKFEPINWTILDADKGYIVTENIIDAQAYSNIVYKKGSGTYSYFNSSSYTDYASNYETSSIREWLNDDFYNTAFSESEKAKIVTTTLKTPSYYTQIGTSGYEKLDSNQTKDKVFLLSYSNIKNSKYGFSSNVSDFDTARITKGSDYAKVQGLYVYGGSESSYKGNSPWMLRTAGSTSYNFCKVSFDGTSGESFYNVHRNSVGIRPALLIKDISSIGKEDEKNDKENNNGNTSSSTKNCYCRCHKTGLIARIIWKFKLIFNRLFGQNRICSCGVNHY